MSTRSLYSLISTWGILMLFTFGAQAFPDLPLDFQFAKADYQQPTQFNTGTVWYGKTLQLRGNDSTAITPENLSEFKLYPQNTMNFGFNPNDVFFLFGLQQGNRIEGYFELSNPVLDEAELYRWSHADRTFYLSGLNGDQIDIDVRYTNHRSILLPATASLHQDELYLLRVKNNGDQFHFDLAFKSDEQVTAGENKTAIAFGAYFGILLFVLIFNIFLVIIIKEKVSVYYALYILSLGLLQLSLNGFGKAFLWPSSLYLSNHVNPITAATGVFFLLLFTRDFLQVERLMPRMAKVLNVMKYVILINIILSFIPWYVAYRSSVLMINGLTMILTFLIVPIAIQAVRKKFKPGRFFAIAFVVLICTVVIFVLRNFGLVPSNALTNYGMQYGSAAEVILLSIAIVDRFKSFKDESLERLEEINAFRKDANEKLEVKVQQRTQEVIQQKAEIEQQKTQLEHQNEEILSSITYAKGIQDAILLPESMVRQLLPNGYISYIPKDIVAGDFYWMEQVGEWLLFAAADCTGHGVPGAMVSVVCHNALDRSVREFGLTDPHLILDKTRELVVNTFERSEREVKDGMDISLIALHKKSGRVKFAGANNPLYWIKEKEDEVTEREIHDDSYMVKVISADRQPVGKYFRSEPFTMHEIQLATGDMIAVTTDGYIDQFGGEKGKKFKAKRFREQLLQWRAIDLPTHQRKMEQEFHEWKGKHEQIDDVCFILYRHN